MILNRLMSKTKLIFIVWPLLVVLISCANESTSSSSNRIFISADIASGLVGGWRSGAADTDDAFAVELISSYVDALVLGVAVVRGNDLQPAELFAAGKIFTSTTGVWNGPIFEGGIEFLPTPNSIEFTGGEGGNENLDELCINEGVTELADLLATSAVPITILAIGPLTDIACLILNFPDVLDNISKLVFLGGRAPNQVLKYSFSDVVFTDFNIDQDLRAAQIVFNNSTIPVTFITFSLSSSTLYTRVQIDSLLDSSCSARGQILSSTSQERMDALESGLNLNGLDTFDINAAYYVAKPDVFNCEEAGFQFVDCEIGTPGVYNGDNNSCAGHGPDQSSGLNDESQQLWVDSSFIGQSRTVTSCISYINNEELEKFQTGTIEVFCNGTVWSEL